MRFKPGDTVIGNMKAQVYAITSPGWVGEVVDVGSSWIRVIGKDSRGKTQDFVVDAECFDLLNQFPEPSSEEFISTLLA